MEDDDLFSAYLGEDPQQTYSIENGMLKVVVGAPNTGTSTWAAVSICISSPYPTTPFWIRSLLD